MHRFGITDLTQKSEVVDAYKVAVEAAITSTEALILSIYTDTSMDDEKKRSRMNDAVNGVEKYGKQYGEKLVDRLHPTIQSTATSTLLQRGSWGMHLKIYGQCWRLMKVLLNSYSKAVPLEWFWLFATCAPCDHDPTTQAAQLQMPLTARHVLCSSQLEAMT
eukprot:4401781-Amphidinium_carterae.4